MKIQAVIFDCDGVLVDSERVFGDVISVLSAEHGFILSPETVMQRFKGGKMADTIAALEADIGHALPGDIEAQIRERMAKAFEQTLQPIPGIEAVLDQLRLPFCVASNGPIEKMEITLGVTGLKPRFAGRIFSAYDVGKWKPDPSLYLHAANMLGTPPEHCAVIEDSSMGVQAGVAAGMQVFGYADLTDKATLAAVGATSFEHMAELPALLGL
ncbi:MAG: HAD-IA family hydrolase [Chloroflexota bacterium]